MRVITIASAFILLFTVPTLGAPNIFKGVEVHASSEQQGFWANLAVDGIASRKSSWVCNSAARPAHTLDVTLKRYYALDSVVIYTGIPEQEKSDDERLQAAGFWGMKNFKLQYWDDANWTDIPETETTENRKDRISFNFKGAIVTFRFRLVSVDGEPIRICEFEGYGKEVAHMAAPLATERTAPNGERGLRNSKIEVKALPEIAGRTMKYVGYNQGYYMPSSNISAWVEYSNVNSLRVWASLGEYVPVRFVKRAAVNDLAQFESLKASLRAEPLSTEFIAWDSIAGVGASVKASANTMVFDYALDELKRLGVEVVLQINDTNFNSSWTNKWQQWQRYYALAFYAARRGDVTMFAMQNEPNHAASGPMRLDVWIDGMRIVSDALHCALEDVGKIYGKQMTARFVGPVTAGTNTNWWATIAAAERVNYRGEKCDKDLIDIFSTHSYNTPAAGYVTKVTTIDKILSQNHPSGATKPVVFTEIGRWMNAYLIDKQETMDSPSLFTEWAGIYTNNMLAGGYGMWAFKMANTVSGVYPRGIKSGHHNIWKGRRFVEDSQTNLALNKPVRAVGQQDGFGAHFVTDGNKSDSSAWHYSGDGPKWVEIDLQQPNTLRGAAIYTGSGYGTFTGTDRIKNLRLEAYVDGSWQVIEGTKESKCKYTQLILPFDKPVTTNLVRFVSEDVGEVSLREIKLFADSPSDAPVSFDISAPLRTAQTVRLFAKGFKDERPLIRLNRSADDPDLDICCSVDSLSGNISVWVVQRNLSDDNVVLDLSALGVKSGAPIVCEVVDDTHYGEAKVLSAKQGGIVEFTAARQSVMLLTITPYDRIKSRQSSALTSVRAGSWSSTAMNKKPLIVELNSGNAQANSAVYMGFDMKKVDVGAANRVLLGVNGRSNDNKSFRTMAYAIFSDKALDTKTLCWNNAPNLDPAEPRMVGVGSDVFVAGEMVFSGVGDESMVDVTELVKRHEAPYVTFVLLREVREPGDDYDKGRLLEVSKKGARMQVW